MKTLLLSIIAIYSINASATPGLNTGLSASTEDVPNIGSAPTLEDCDCDGEEDEAQGKEEKKEKETL